MSDEVKAGQPISARLWNVLVGMVRRGRPLQGPGIILKQTASGTIIEAAGSQARDFMLGRVSSVNGDSTGTFSQVYPSAITYGVKIKDRPDLNEVTFAVDAIIRSARPSDFKVWPMPINTPVCVMIAKTDNAASPQKLYLVAIEAPYTEACGAP